MDVQGLVRAGTVSPARSTLRALIPIVTAAFEDASKLVVRIRDQRVNTDRALADEPTRDLLESLALGPTIVKGQFDYEHKRWAEPYAVGDIQAREQLKDVLIALQMTVVIVLRTVYMDELDVDFNALQTASDDCRVNAGVCLGQLSQRLSDQAKAVSMWPQSQLNSYHYGLPAVHSATPGLTHSTSRSTFSSPGYAARTPQDLSDRLNNMSLAPGTPKQAIGLLRTADPEITSMRRPSSTTLSPDDVEFLSSVAEGPPDNGVIVHLPGADDLDRASYVSLNTNTGNVSSPQWLRSPIAQQASAIPPRQNPRERYGPDDYIPGDGAGEQSPGHSDDLDRSSSHDSASASFSARAIEQNHSTLEHIGYLHQYGGQPTLPYPQNQSLMPQPQTQPQPQPQPLLQSPDIRPFSPPQAPPAFQTRQDSLGKNSSSNSYRVFPPSNPPPLNPRHDRPAVSGPIPVNPPPTLHQPVMPQRAPTGNITGPPRPPNNESLHPPPHIVTQSAFPQQQAPSNHTAIAPPQHPPSNNTAIAPPQRSASNNPTIPLPQRSPSRPSTMSSVPNIPLNLPTEKVTQGFCKGAVRLFLQNGVSNKAFSAANRPVGLSGMVPYWRCDKCNFEGPVVTHINMGLTNKKKKGKEEKIFDPKVRVSMGGGVRYKWAFLAKSHCTLKSQVDYTSPAAKQGEIGAFQCLFCLAEGNARGWTSGGGPGTTSGNVSIRSGSTGSGNARGSLMPVFGNLQMFLEHLDQTHRQEQGWPGAEMLGRMKCVVGRIASGDEDWDVNFVPIRDDEVSSGRQA